MNAVALPSLDAFRASATQGGQLYLRRDAADGQWQVCAATADQDPGAAALSQDGEAVSVFLTALAQAFSTGIQQAVAHELGLESGSSLSAQHVQQAITMAEASIQALQGVDFMTQLAHSAVAQGTGFAAACRAQGVQATAFGAQQRASIDAAMQQRFAQAARQGQCPVDERLVQQWLRSELLRALGPQPTSR